MSRNIDPQEVLTYLNELGYRNISSHQLKEFLKDLQKLIKYDLKQEIAPENIENICPDTCPNTDKYMNLHATSTVSSRAKQVPRKESIISVQIKRPIKKKVLECSESAVKNICRPASAVKTSGGEMCTSEYSLRPPQSSSSNFDRKTSASKTNCKENALKPQVSFIRPRLPLKLCKSDPVALYQHYKEEWKKQKVPGEDNHYNLRWAIRERMLGEPRITTCEAPSLEVLSRKRKIFKQSEPFRV